MIKGMTPEQEIEYFKKKSEEFRKSKWVAKPFDSVKMMRDIRDKISDETQSMTLEQLKKYIADRLKNPHLKTIGR
jgi:hypothetical protein